MPRRLLTLLSGGKPPKIQQPQEHEPSIINEKTVADFTRVVEQTGILDRQPRSPKEDAPDGQRATSAQASGDRRVIQPVPCLFVAPTGNSVAPGRDGNTLDRAEGALGPFGAMHRRGVGRSTQSDQ
jgi:hypothetical protein